MNRIQEGHLWCPEHNEEFPEHRTCLVCALESSDPAELESADNCSFDGADR